MSRLVFKGVAFLKSSTTSTARASASTQPKTIANSLVRGGNTSNPRFTTSPGNFVSNFPLRLEDTPSDACGAVTLDQAEQAQGHSLWDPEAPAWPASLIDQYNDNRAWELEAGSTWDAENFALGVFADRPPHHLAAVHIEDSSFEQYRDHHETKLRGMDWLRAGPGEFPGKAPPRRSSLRQVPPSLEDKYLHDVYADPSASSGTVFALAALFHQHLVLKQQYADIIASDPNGDSKELDNVMDEREVVERLMGAAARDGFAPGGGPAQRYCDLYTQHLEEKRSTGKSLVSDLEARRLRYSQTALCLRERSGSVDLLTVQAQLEPTKCGTGQLSILDLGSKQVPACDLIGPVMAVVSNLGASYSAAYDSLITTMNSLRLASGEK